jgi:hypothetical protein
MNTRIGFSTVIGNPVSWLIRKMTKSECSHVWFLYHDVDFQADMVMDAHETGFRIIPYEKFKKKNKIIAVIEPRQDMSEGLKRVALEYLGTMYDYPGLFGMIPVKIGQFFKRKWKNPFKSKHMVECAESVIRAMHLSPACPAEVSKWDPEETDPDTVKRFLIKDSILSSG